MYLDFSFYRMSTSAKISRRVMRYSWDCFFILLLIFALGSLQHARADVGDRTRLGKVGEWKGTFTGVAVNNYLYTIEKSGALYVTDLSSGKWRQLGKPEFVNTRFLFAAGQSLYTIETDGSLYRVSQSDGTWSRVGQPGVWKGTIAGATLNGRLYTVETTGILYETNPATGAWKQLSKAEFARTKHMFGASGSLYTIENNGLYRINTRDGSWALVGKTEDWSGTRAVAVMGDRLYSVNRNGALYESQLASGQWSAIGKQLFGNTILLFESGYKLYAIDADGSLYAVETAPLAG